MSAALVFFIDSLCAYGVKNPLAVCPFIPCLTKFACLGLAFKKP